jgi:hypothetical protein
MFCFPEPHTWRPNIHFLRNCCLSELGSRILHKIRRQYKKNLKEMWAQEKKCYKLYSFSLAASLVS